jgi:Zn-dependent peptidase ImmA (M78 family)
MREIEHWATRAREFWGLGESPISNLLRVAENNGAIVIRDYLDAETLDALSEWLEPEGVPFVVLNADKESAVRSRMDLAHELGHIVLHRGVRTEDLNKKVLFKQIEQQAFRFAGALLLPERPFLRDLHSLSLDALRALKSKWGVAIGAMIHRIADLGVLSEDQEKRLWINYNRRGWRRREPLDDQLAFEMPSLLPQAFQILIDQGHDREQIPGSIGHGRSQIEQVANLPENFLMPSISVQAKIIPFKKA